MCLRILFVHAGAELYGADRILLELVTELKNRGHATYVVLPNDGELVTLLTKAGIQVQIKNLGVLRRKYFTIKGLFNRFSRLDRKSVV